MTYHRYGLTDEEFIAAWNASEDLKDVTAKTGMPTSNCQTRASLLRSEKDVPLPRLSRDKKNRKDEKP